MGLLGRLSLLWASVTAASCMLHTTGPQPRPVVPAPPPAPTLSLSPPHGIFARGERVRLTCSPPGGWRPEEFLFYKLKPDGRWALQIKQKEDTWELSTAHLETQSTFVCTYSEGNGTREFLQSRPSNLCRVSLTDLIPELPPATLSLDPEFPVYLRGERATLACSAPAGQRVSGYLFYKEQRDRTLKQLPSTGQGPYEALEVGRSTAGKYSCAYWVLLSGREIRSPHSSLVSVAVTERPRPPIFSVSPKQEVYGSGELITLTCLALDRRHVSRITFLKERQRLLATPLPSSRDNSTRALRLLPQDGGRYSCQYQAVESGREIPSPTSNIISISVMAVTVPEPSAVVRPAHTYGTTAGVPGSSRAPTSPALQPTSSQLAIEERPHPAKPDGPAASVPSSSQPTSHGGLPCSTNSQSSAKPLGTWGSTEPWGPRVATKPFDSQSSSKTFPGSSDPSSTSQTRTGPVEENGKGAPPPGETLRLPLVAGCTAAGILSLVLLAWLLRKKLKGNSKRPSRSFWETLDDQHFRRISRISHHSRSHPGPQERASQVANEDWGILPKSRHGGTAKQSKADDDCGAEFKFPEIDLTYTFGGYPCSTFFEAEYHSPC